VKDHMIRELKDFIKNTRRRPKRKFKKGRRPEYADNNRRDSGAFNKP